MHEELVTRCVFEFLVCYVHNAAYKLEVYPKETFTLCNAYNIKAYHNNHPQVQEWIENACKKVINLVYTTKTNSANVSLLVLTNSVPVFRICINLSEYEILVAGKNTQPLKVQNELGNCISRLLSANLPVISGDKSLSFSFEGSLKEPPSGWSQSKNSSNKDAAMPQSLGTANILNDNGDHSLVVNIYSQFINKSTV